MTHCQGMHRVWIPRRHIHRKHASRPDRQTLPKSFRIILWMSGDRTGSAGQDRQNRDSLRLQRLLDLRFWPSYRIPFRKSSPWKILAREASLWNREDCSHQSYLLPRNSNDGASWRPQPIRRDNAYVTIPLSKHCFSSGSTQWRTSQGKHQWGMVRRNETLFESCLDWLTLHNHSMFHMGNHRRSPIYPQHGG